MRMIRTLAMLGGAAFAGTVLALGWRDALAGAWLGVGTIALAPLALALLVARTRRDTGRVPAAAAEDLAWVVPDQPAKRQPPRGGLPVRIARPPRGPMPLAA